VRPFPRKDHVKKNGREKHRHISVLTGIPAKCAPITPVLPPFASKNRQIQPKCRGVGRPYYAFFPIHPTQADEYSASICNEKFYIIIPVNIPPNVRKILKIMEVMRVAKSGHSAPAEGHNKH
ncbi:MAG: hypothetical protein WAS33_29655, partial [Candidatus Promineifilaceae bacterium]